MTSSRSHPDRRRYQRFPLGLPVELRIEGHADALTVEIVDIAPRGVRFRAMGAAIVVDQRASFGFVVAGHDTCTATGRVVRTGDGGEFVLAVERANLPFLRFVRSLAT